MSTQNSIANAIRRFYELQGFGEQLVLKSLDGKINAVIKEPLKVTIYNDYDYDPDKIKTDTIEELIDIVLERLKVEK